MSIKGPTPTLEVAATLEKIVAKSNSLSDIMGDSSLKMRSGKMLDIRNQASTLLIRLKLLQENKSLLKQIKIFELKRLLEIMLSQVDDVTKLQPNHAAPFDLIKTKQELTTQYKLSTLNTKTAKGKEREKKLKQEKSMKNNRIY